MLRWMLIGSLLFTGCGDDGGDGPAADAGPTAVDSGPPAPDAGPGGEVDAGPADAGGVDGAAAGDAGPPPPEGEPVDPSSAGAYEHTTVDHAVMRMSRATPVRVYLPVRDDAAPLAVVLPGYSMEHTRYAALAERIVSHGFAVLLADPPDGLFGFSHAEMELDAQAALDWVLEAHADAIDATRIAVMGHSLGGKLAAMMAASDPRVTALFGIDPANAPNILGGGGFDEAFPDALAGMDAVTVPVGFVGETVNKVDGGFARPACAPEGMNYEAFYEGTPMAPWAAQWHFEGADHMDFVPDTSLCFTCGTCAGGTADPEVVLAGMYTLAVAFLHRHLGADPRVDAWLVGESVPETVTVTSRP